jgi:hypothetical protein
VHQVLINEKYIGNNVWNRTSGKLKQPRTPNPVDQLVRADSAFSSGRPRFVSCGAGHYSSAVTALD